MRNRRGRGGRVSPDILTGKYFLSRGKRGAGKTGKMERKRRKIWKGKGGKLNFFENGRGKGMKMSRGLLLLLLFFGFVFLFFVFCFVFLFACFLLLVTFRNYWNLFGLYMTKMGKFYQEKAYFTPGKISGKATLPPLENIPLTPLKTCDYLIRSIGKNN